MKVKTEFYLSSPLVFDSLTPFDGVLSFLLATARGYCLQGEREEFIWGNLTLPVSLYGYVKDLPLKKVDYGNGFFYAVSVLFGKGRKENKVIYRKFPNYARCYFLLPSARKKFAIKDNTNLLHKIGSGKFRGMQIPLDAFCTEKVWFYADVSDDRIDDFVEIVETAKHTGIGKKTGHGYGQVERVEIIPEEDFSESYDGVFVETEKGKIPARPIPLNLVEETSLPEGKYPVEVYVSVLPPYYLPVKMERCFFCYPYPLEEKK